MRRRDDPGASLAGPCHAVPCHACPCHAEPRVGGPTLGPLSQPARWSSRADKGMRTVIGLLVSLIVALLIAGLLIWIVRTLAPSLGLPPSVVQVVTVVVVVLLIVWIVQVFLGHGPLVVPDVR